MILESVEPALHHRIRNALSILCPTELLVNLLISRVPLGVQPGSGGQNSFSRKDESEYVKKKVKF